MPLFLNVVLPIVLAFVTWTFLEYAMHNWWGHVPKGKNAFSKQHLTHHADSMYFAPTVEKAKMAALVMAVVSPVAMLIAGPLPGGVFAAAVVSWYLIYEIIHRRTHTHAPRNGYSRWTRKHHLHHHFSSPFKNHGVTTPIWDIVFRTYEKPGQIRVPRRHAMLWLCDAEGNVKPEYEKDYVLVGRMPKSKKRKTHVNSAEVDRGDLTAAFAGMAPTE